MNMNRFLSAVALIMLPVYALSQTVDGDSLRAIRLGEMPVGRGDTISATSLWRPIDELPDAMLYLGTPFTFVNDYYAPDFKGNFSLSPYVFQWANGGVYGSGGAMSMPGLIAVESGRLALEQELGRFTLTAYGEALKYGYFRGLSTTYGFGGSLTYHASDRLSLTLFGSYYSPLRALTPAMAGYMNLPSVGAYADYSFSDRWGVKAGVQSYRSMITGRWETQPIVMPYFKVSGDHAIGVDVGGMLYQIIRSAASDSRNSYSNPTIPPPLTRVPEQF